MAECERIRDDWRAPKGHDRLVSVGRGIGRNRGAPVGGREASAARAILHTLLNCESSRIQRLTPSPSSRRRARSGCTIFQ
jgi:hypothetical protein